MSCWANQIQLLKIRRNSWSLTWKSLIFDFLFFNEHFMHVYVSSCVSSFQTKLLIKSFNSYWSADCLLRGTASLSVLLHVYVIMLLCFDVYFAIDWLTLKYKDGRKRNYICSLFNALSSWDVSICSTIYRVRIPVKKKEEEEWKSGMTRAEGRRPYEFKIWAGRLKTVTVRLLAGRNFWRSSGDIWALRSKNSPVCHLLWCLIRKKWNVFWHSRQTMHLVWLCMPKEGYTVCVTCWS